MKDMKKNSVQLVIAGIVVVLVAFCGTFAWFASGDRSWVRHIGANVSSPSTEESINSGISEIQIYDPVSENWEIYDGEIPLNFVPGQYYKFKVLFNADPSQHTWLRLTGFEVPPDEDDTPALINVLQYGVKFSEDVKDEDVDYQDFKINKESNDPFIEFIDDMLVKDFKKDGDEYVLYYLIKLPGKSVDNDYFDQSFTADVELIFQ